MKINESSFLLVQQCKTIIFSFQRTYGLRLSRICCFFKQLLIHGRILNLVKHIGEELALACLKAEVTSFLARLHSCHNKGHFVLIAFLKSLYRRFILYSILSLIYGTDVFLILTCFQGAWCRSISWLFLISR